MALDLHYNDEAEHHEPIALTTFRDGHVMVSGECCSCRLRDPDFIAHMKSTPDTVYTTFIPFTLNLQ